MGTLEQLKEGRFPFRLTSGVDTISIEDFEGLIHQAHGQALLESLFTPAELARYGGRIDSLAARLAAKEAVGKALGAGVPLEGWHGIEVLDEKNVPSVSLRGWARQCADEIGLRDLAVSLSHEHKSEIGRASCRERV